MDFNRESLPTNWTLATMGEVVKFEYGQSLTKEKRQNNGMIPVYGSNGIVGYHNESLVKQPCLIIGRKGAAGAIHISQTPCWPIDTTYFVIPPDTIILQFLYYLLSAMQLSKLDRSTAIPGLNRDDAYSLEIPIPPLPEQERIVAKIEELFTQLDAGTAALKRVQAGLKRYKASVLKAAVEGRLVPQDPNDEPVEEVLHRLGKKTLNKEDLPELPLGWCWSNLNNVTTNIKDVDHKMPKEASSDIPYVSTRDFCGDDEINFTDAKHISEEDYVSLSRKIKPEKGDILLSRYGTIGEIRRVKVDKKFQASYSIAIIKPLPIEELSNYLMVFLRSNFGQEQMRKKIRASSQPDLGLSSIREFVIPLPPIQEQLRIVDEIERLFSVIQELEEVVTINLVRTTNMRQSILTNAFEGKLI